MWFELLVDHYNVDKEKYWSMILIIIGIVIIMIIKNFLHYF